MKIMQIRGNNQDYLNWKNNVMRDANSFTPGCHLIMAACEQADETGHMIEKAFFSTCPKTKKITLYVSGDPDVFLKTIRIIEMKSTFLLQSETPFFAEEKYFF